jgi:hypothetical protein
MSTDFLLLLPELLNEVMSELIPSDLAALLGSCQFFWLQREAVWQTYWTANRQRRVCYFCDNAVFNPDMIVCVQLDPPDEKSDCQGRCALHYCGPPYLFTFCNLDCLDTWNLRETATLYKYALFNVHRREAEARWTYGWYTCNARLALPAWPKKHELNKQYRQ